MSRQKDAAKTAYHHGDLRRQLVEEAIAMVKVEGIESLSLRKLAERVGVSQTALYHHFGDKQALLCAMGEEAICRFEAHLQQAMRGKSATEHFVSAYVGFALKNPELYELMFGRTTWRGENDEGSQAFKTRARASFRAYAEIIAMRQKEGVLPADINTLRLAQTCWATLHGLCCMYNNGLALTAADVEEIAQFARRLLEHELFISGRK